jgi:hypothetical protein
LGDSQPQLFAKEYYRCQESQRLLLLLRAQFRHTIVRIGAIVEGSQIAAMTVYSPSLATSWEGLDPSGDPGRLPHGTDSWCSSWLLSLRRLAFVSRMLDMQAHSKIC